MIGNKLKKQKIFVTKPAQLTYISANAAKDGGCGCGCGCGTGN